MVGNQLTAMKPLNNSAASTAGGASNGASADLPSPRLISSTKVYQAKKFSVTEDLYDVAGKGEIDRSTVRHGGAAVIVPRSADLRFGLVRQYRYALEQDLLEFPAGTIEYGEPPENCAAREIEEEIGFRAERLIPLGSFFSAPGFCNERLFAFLAEGLTQSATKYDHSELISDVSWLTLAEIKTAIKNGEILDAKSIASVLLLELICGE